MNLDEVFDGFPIYEPAPRNATYPAIAGTATRVRVPPYLASRVGGRSLGVAGRVEYPLEPDPKYRPPALQWWWTAQVMLLLLRRMALGALVGNTSQYLEDGRNWIQSDTVFGIASAIGNRLTLIAPDEDFDARDWIIGNETVENPLWFPDNELGYIRFLQRPIRGSAQLGDEIQPAPNSVLRNKCIPMIVRLDLPDNYAPGMNFTVVLDQDIDEIDTKRDPEGDEADFCSIRVHAITPAPYKPLVDSRPLRCRPRLRTLTRGQIDALPGGKLVLSTRRLARPYGEVNGFRATFRVEIIAPDVEEAEDITAGFLGAGRLAVTHASGDAWESAVWVGPEVRGETLTDLIEADEVLLITYYEEIEEGDTGYETTVVPCQGACHWARLGPQGETFCALAHRGSWDYPNNAWVENPPAGLAALRRDCYQWTSAQANAPVGCPDFTERTPTQLSDWADFWNQCWTGVWVRSVQVTLGLPLERYRVDGIPGLLHVGGGRLQRNLDMGELRQYLVDISSACYRTSEQDIVTGLLWGVANTEHPALGPGLPPDDPEAYEPPGILEHSAVVAHTLNNLGLPWDADNDPTQGQRNKPIMPALQAEESDTTGRSVDTNQRLVTWREVCLGVQHPEDTDVHPSHNMYWRGDGAGGVVVGFADDANPLSVFSNTVVSATVAAATEDSGLWRLELEPTWRTVTFFNTDVPPQAVQGTIRAGGVFVRPDQRFELPDDDGYGDGNNVQRGACPGDVVVFSAAGEFPDVLVGQAFEVVKAAPFAGASFASGWNNNPGDTPPTNLLVPDGFTDWGTKRDVVWVRPRVSIPGGVEELVGLTASAGQAGVWGGPGVPSVTVAEPESTSWASVVGCAVNYLTGAITIPAAVLELLPDPMDVRVEGLVYDRRRYIRAHDANLLRATMAALDTYRVPLTFGAVTTDITVLQQESRCATSPTWGGSNEYDEDDLITWVEGGYSTVIIEDVVSTSGRAAQGDFPFENPAERLLNPGINLVGAVFGFPTGGFLTTCPDDVEVASAYLIYSFETVTETVIVDTIVANTLINRSTTVTEGNGSMAAVLTARRHDRAKREILWVGPSVSVTEGEWAALNITDAIRRYLSTWRRGKYVEFGFLLAPGIADYSPDEQDQAQMLQSLISHPSFSVYTPQYITCDANPDTPGSAGALNPGLDRSYTWTQKIIEYTGLAAREGVVTLSSYPGTLAGLPLAEARLVTNEAPQGAWRRTRGAVWPAAAEE